MFNVLVFSFFFTVAFFTKRVFISLSILRLHFQHFNTLGFYLESQNIICRFGFY